MRVVLYSSEDEEFLERTVAECGADGYIPKSTPPQELPERVLQFVPGW